MMLIDLLADKEAATRVRAAQALGMWRGAEAAAVLRLKAHVGDEAAEVLGEVCASLLRHDARGQLDFVARFLNHGDAGVVEAAALALGESRQGEALGPLIAAWERLGREPMRTSILMAIALLRREESLAWLLARVADARPATALEMLEALRIFRGDEKIVARIAEAARGRKEVAAGFQEMFG
jgi:HEAT repeat protein